MTFDGGLQISFDGVHQGRSTALRLKAHSVSDVPAWPASPGFGGADSVKVHVRLPRMFGRFFASGPRQAGERAARRASLAVAGVDDPDPAPAGRRSGL